MYIPTCNNNIYMSSWGRNTVLYVIYICALVGWNKNIFIDFSRFRNKTLTFLSNPNIVFLHHQRTGACSYTQWYILDIKNLICLMLVHHAFFLLQNLDIVTVTNFCPRPQHILCYALSHTFAWSSIKCSRSLSIGSSLKRVNPDCAESRQPTSWFSVDRNSSIVVEPSKLTTCNSSPA